MPEYLSPGVYIEEIPSRLKAIEGVSTSTAGFVGLADRGTVAGFPLPYALSGADTQRVALPGDPAPVLVTSFADFARQFGLAAADPAQGRRHLAHAVRAFFDNGGRRCFISRVVDLTVGAGGEVTSSAARASARAGQGTILRLTRRARPGDEVLFLNSLRDISTVGPAPGNTLNVLRLSDDGAVAGSPFTVTGYDTRGNSVQLGAPLEEGVTLDPGEVYIVPGGAAEFSADGPRFHARNPGAWGDGIRVIVAIADRAPAPVTVALTVPSPAPSPPPDTLQVASTSSFYTGAIVEVDHGTPGLRTYHLVAEILPGNRLRLDPGLDLSVGTDGFVRVNELDIALVDETVGVVETYKGVTWSPSDDPGVRRRHYSTAINTRSRLAYVQPVGVGGLGAGPEPIDLLPMTPRGEPMPLSGGDDGDDPEDEDYVGVDLGPGRRTGIQALQDAEDIRIVACPGITAAVVQNALIAQCERLRYRFAVLDGEAEPSPGGPVVAILAHRNAYDSAYAAYYTPWIEIADGDRRILLPPSGHVAGIYARVDNDRGVWKAPANEVLRNITGLQSYFTAGEQDLLNPRGVNVIRRFEGRGIRVWGGRTLSSDPEFRYVNVRRFLIFLEASLDRGTQWVVFEPNAPETWSRVVDSVGAFLNTQWRSGALFGRRPEDAYFVRCDETTMTVDDVQNGRLICLIGVAIVRPAEFVIFRIEQITGFARQG